MLETQMKGVALSLILITLTSPLLAQDASHKFSVGLNMVRYAPLSSSYYAPSGYLALDQGEDELLFINGFDLGYQQNQWLGYFVEFRNMNFYNNAEDLLDGFEKLNTKGVEVSLGPTFSTDELFRLSLMFSIEAFGEFAKVKGLKNEGTIEIFEVNHRKNYFGIAPALTINFRVTERVYLYAQTRYRIGHVSYKALGGIDFPFKTTLWSYKDFTCYQYEPLSSFGLKVCF